MGRGEGGGFRMGSTCIPEIFLILKIKLKKKKLASQLIIVIISV